MIMGGRMSAVALQAARSGTDAAGYSGPLGWFNDLTVKVKIFVLLAFALLLTALVGLTGQLAINSVQAAGDKVATVTAQRAIDSLSARAEWGGYRRSVILA